MPQLTHKPIEGAKTMNMQELTHAVLCCPKGQAFFELIAAFNVDVVAEKYALACKAANPSFTYKVKAVKPSERAA